MLSVIVPAYNEENTVKLVREELAKVLNGAGIDYELLFIDDGSNDATWKRIRELSAQNQSVKGLHFSRNFGKEAAMFAGLEEARGDCAVVIDCDLQHPPEKIVEMYRLWEQGYEVVEGVKADRGKETVLHRAAANGFYKFISGSLHMDMSSSSDFKLLDRKVVDTLNSLPERKVFFRALSYWVGFKRAEVSYEVRQRVDGESKWSKTALIKYAITNMASFSSAPLHIITILGVLELVVAVIFGAVALVQKISGRALGGFTTVILLLLFTSSIIVISLGIIAYYLGRIYEELKGRPRYIISERCGKER